MKKLLAGILTALMILACTSCGVDKEAVDMALQGSWTYSWYAEAVGITCASAYVFGDGEVAHAFKGANDYSETGTYQIKGNKIICEFPDKEDQVFHFTFNDGVLTLVDKGDGTVENVYTKRD